MLLPLFDVDPNVNSKMLLAIPLDNVVNCYFIFALVLVGHILLQITFTIQSNSLGKKISGFVCFLTNLHLSVLAVENVTECQV